MGTFVEVKNSDIGAGAKIPHLSYIGDADVGERSNLGAGTITANYDGHAKHRTTIGKRVRGGVDTAFVAPVTVGDDAYTAAGSVIVEDVPPARWAWRARARSTARGTRSGARTRPRRSTMPDRKRRPRPRRGSRAHETWCVHRKTSAMPRLDVYTPRNDERDGHACAARRRACRSITTSG